MKVTPVTSAQNPSLKRIRLLHERAGREKEGLFLLEGAKVLNEAFARGITIHDVVVSKNFWTEGMPNVDQAHLNSMSVVDDKLFKELMTTQSPSGVIAVGTARQYSFADCLKGEETLVVVGEAIQDPGNAGTLIRAALAFGASGVVLTKGSVDAYNPKVVRSAMGALFALPVVTGVEAGTVAAQLKSANVRVLALEPSTGKRLCDTNLRGSVAVVLGNEGNGLSQDALNLADELVTIPMTETTESLNVAVCGAIVLYECAQQRRSDQA
jgi:TrmH family RNA methyltransferase